MPRGRKLIKTERELALKSKPVGDMVAYNMCLGENLAAIIRENYADIPWVLNQFHLPDDALSLFEDGKIEIPAHLIWRMAEHLDIPIDRFFKSSPKEWNDDFNFVCSKKPKL